MSNPESPVESGSSNSARMPVSLTSLHNPLNGGPVAINVTLNPVLVRGSRYTNLRILSKSLISVGPVRAQKSIRPVIPIGGKTSLHQGIHVSLEFRAEGRDQVAE